MKNWISSVLLLALGATALAGDVGAPYTVYRMGASSLRPGFGAIDLSQSAATTNALPVNRGGTGVAAISSAGVVIGNGTSAVTSVAPGSDNNVLKAVSGAWTSGSAPSAVLAKSAKTSTYTLQSTDDVITASGSAFTLNLPAASTVSGKVFTLIKTDASLSNIITVDANGSETIDGALTKKLVTQYERLQIMSDGSNWFTLSRSWPDTPTSYTIAISGGTKCSSPTVDAAYWSRASQSTMRIFYSFHCSTTGASAGSGTYGFAIPSGVTAFTTAVPVPGLDGGEQRLGSASAYNGVANVYGGVYLLSSSALTMILGDATQATSNVGSTFYQLGATAVSYGFEATIPISEWQD